MKKLIIKKENINYYIMIFLFFLFIFGIQFSNIPINSSKIVLLFLILFFILKKIKITINQDLIIFIGWLVILMLLSFIRAFTSIITYDFSIPYQYFIFIFEAFWGSYLLIILLDRFEFNLENLLNIIIYICFIQALIMILMFISPAIREFIFSVTRNNNIDLFVRMGGFRGLGLAGSVTYDLSVFLSIGIMLISYKIVINQKIKFTYSIISFTIILAIILCARSGFIGVFLSIIYILLNTKRKKDIKKIFSILVKVVLIVFIFVFIIVNVVNKETMDLIFTELFPWAFEIFNNFFASGKIETKSTNRLMEMYFPLSENTLLHGDGYWKSTTEPDRYYMNTDAGYVRHIAFYGLPISLLLYGFYLFFFYYIYKFAKYLGNDKFAFLIILLAFYYFLVHIKGNFLLGSSMNIKFFCLLTTYFIYRKNTLKSTKLTR